MKPIPSDSTITPVILDEAEKFAREIHHQDGTGHDWWHVDRVRKLALSIAKAEGANSALVELVALLHDIDDWKLLAETGQSGRVVQWLINQNLDGRDVALVVRLIESVSYKGAGVDTSVDVLEGKVVQDADRLDAMGAIGIARTFAYGGSKKRLLYDPAIQPELHSDFASYQSTTAPTINHFYEKLLLLKDRMQTTTGKRLAVDRHQFMEKFLQRFFEEWSGNVDILN